MWVWPWRDYVRVSALTEHDRKMVTVISGLRSWQTTFSSFLTEPSGLLTHPSGIVVSDADRATAREDMFMQFWNRWCRAVAVLVAIFTPTLASAQSTSVGVVQSAGQSHRPWIGLALGTGFLGGEHVEPDDSRDVGVSVDIPLQPLARLRVGGGRLSVNGADFGEFALRRVTIDGVALIPFPRARRPCQSHFVLGGGIGLYNYGLGNEFSETRHGYQLSAGGECVGSRASFGLAMTGRSIRGPANRQLPGAKMFALDMHFGIKLRL
jgi:fluoride ion exporter CrcB/FEX